MGRIETAFARARSEGRAALIPFITAGDPSIAASQDILEALVQGGADIVELGLAFSDPLADGPVIQRSSRRALDAGVTPTDALRLAERFRAAHPDVGLVFLTYYNLVLQRGLDAFASDAARAGVDGLVVADLSLEESEPLRSAAARQALALIPFVAPTTPHERLGQVARLDPAFVYCVALTGVTGARQRVAEQTIALLRSARAAIDAPLAVGFGISSPDHVHQLRGEADGVIVGSALVEVIERGPHPDLVAVESFVRALRMAAAG